MPDHALCCFSARYIILRNISPQSILIKSLIEEKYYFPYPSPVSRWEQGGEEKGQTFEIIVFNMSLTSDN